MKRTTRILLTVAVVGTVLASVGTTAVVADKKTGQPKHNPQSNHCQNYKGGDEPHAGPGSGPNCPGSKKGGALTPFLILAPMGLRAKSLESLVN